MKKDAIQNVLTSAFSSTAYMHLHLHFGGSNIFIHLFIYLFICVFVGRISIKSHE